MNISLAIFAAVLLFVSSVYAQPCPGNLIRDSNFEGNSYYCRASADDIANDQVTLCTISYNGTDLRSQLGANQVNLTSTLQSGAWSSNGQVDVITGNYQPTSGFWALKLNGQFAAGSIQQTISVPLDSSFCTLSFSDASNIRAPIGFSSSYQVVVQRLGDASPVFNASRTAPSVPNPRTTATLIRENVTMTLGAAGSYVISFVSNDRNPTTFNDGLYTSQTYYGRTGAIIDSVCLTCLSSPSPSVTATPSASVSFSSSSSFIPSISSSVSRSPIPSVVPSVTPSPQPSPQCPAPIEDDDDNCSQQPPQQGDGDSTTINIFFADIFGGGDRRY